MNSNHIMENTYFLVVFSIILAIARSGFGELHHRGSEDYCLLDNFGASCKDNEVIVINSALYGRMRNNRCITNSHGQIGCFVDVKKLIEGFCAGRKQCEVSVSQKSLLTLKPCTDTFNFYLSVSYSCLDVMTGTKESCQRRGATTMASDAGVLASSVAMATGPGSVQCPWMITSKSGKQLNFTLQRFNTAPTDSNSPPVCHEVLTIKEDTKMRPNNILLCPSDAANKTVYVSNSNQAIVTFPASQNDQVYLLHFEVTGCSTPVVSNAHVTRKGRVAMATCNNTRESWQLICEGDAWSGEEKYCSEGWNLASTLGGEEGPPLGMLLIVVTGIALGVLIGGFLLYLAINAFKRYHGLLPGQQIQNPSYEKPFYNPNNKLAGYDERTIQRSSMIYGTQRRSYPNRQMLPPVPPPHADNAQMRPPSEISECNRQSHIYETPLFNSL